MSRRSARAASDECKRRLTALLAGGRRKRPRVRPPESSPESPPRVVNTTDAITLDPIGLTDPHTFLSPVDKGAARAYDARALFTWCVQCSQQEPRDPVSHRVFTEDELRRIEALSGHPPGALAAARELHLRRESAHTNDIESDANQTALLQMLCEVIDDAYVDAVRACAAGTSVAQFVRVLMAEAAPQMEQLVGGLRGDRDRTLEQLRRHLDQKFAAATERAEQHPDLPAFVGLISELLVLETRAQWGGGGWA